MKNICLGLIVTIIVSVLLPVAHADDFQIGPYLGVRGAYNDNIFFDTNSNEVQDSFILTILPGIELTERTERLNARLSGEVAPFFYQADSNLDHVDQDYRARIGYRFTPRFYGEADAFFIVDHRPDRDFLATGLVQSFEKRDRYHFGGEMEYIFSEKDSISLNYEFNRDDWEQSSDLDDVNYYGVSLSLDRNLADWLRETNGQLIIGYNKIKRDVAKSDSFVGEVAFHYRLSELFRLRLRGGARYVSSDFDTVKARDPATGALVIGKDSNSGWGGVGSAILEYAGERTSSALIFSHDISSGSGRATPTVLTRAVGTVNYRLLEKMRLGLSAEGYHNKADSGEFGFEAIDQYTFRIRPNIRWEFYDDFALEAAYRYTYGMDDLRDKTASRNTVYLELTYGFPFFDFFDLSGLELQQVVSGTVPVQERR